MAQRRQTLMDPPIEELLDKVDSKFTLVALGALRAREVNSYYNSLGQGLGRVVPPQVASVSGKPLSIAFEEIAEAKATYERYDPEEEAALAEAQAQTDSAAELVAVDGGLSSVAQDTDGDVSVQVAQDTDGDVSVQVAHEQSAASNDEGPAAG
ncbi:MAG: DNA-directed RNA polymerase subunit omega [Acidimicrobiales bacterium]